MYHQSNQVFFGKLILSSLSTHIKYRTIFKNKNQFCHSHFFEDLTLKLSNSSSLLPVNGAVSAISADKPLYLLAGTEGGGVDWFPRLFPREATEKKNFLGKYVPVCH
jgi:hypothetical protein